MNIRTVQMTPTATFMPAWVAFDLDAIDGSGPIGVGSTEDEAKASLIQDSPLPN